MPAEPAFDTNLVIYALAASADEASGSVAERLSAAERNRKRSIAQTIVTTPSRLSVQLLNEFASVALRKLRMPPSAVASVIEGLCFVHRVDPLDAARNRLALDLVAETGYSFYDCLMLAAALKAGCERFWSEDLTHGRTIAGRLVVLNPFTGGFGAP